MTSSSPTLRRPSSFTASTRVGSSSPSSGKSAHILDLGEELKAVHSASFELDVVIQVDGAGSWPPHSSFEESWPSCLRFYAEVCDLAAKRFTKAEEQHRSSCASGCTSLSRSSSRLSFKNLSDPESDLTSSSNLLTGNKCVNFQDLGPDEDCNTQYRTSIERMCSSDFDNENDRICPFKNGNDSSFPEYSAKSLKEILRSTTQSCSDAEDLDKISRSVAKSCPILELRPLQGKQRVNSSILRGLKEVNPVQEFRSWLRTELSARIVASSSHADHHFLSQEVMPQVMSLNPAQRNGLHCCLTYLSHMYRWGKIPVMEQAQNEKELAQIQMPELLWRPFCYLSDAIGVSQVGNCFSAFLLNSKREKGATEKEVATQRCKKWKDLNAPAYYAEVRLVESRKQRSSAAESDLELAPDEDEYAKKYSGTSLMSCVSTTSTYPSTQDCPHSSPSVSASTDQENSETNCFYPAYLSDSEARFLFNKKVPSTSNDATNLNAISDTEQNFINLWYDMEASSLPMYREMTTTLCNLCELDLEEALYSLTQCEEHAKATYQTFYKGLSDTRIRRDLWLPHVQGAWGWGLDGVGGLNGAQVLCIHALDCFLQTSSGVCPMHAFATENRRAHLTAHQRRLLDLMEKNSCASILKKLENGGVNVEALKEVFNRMVTDLRRWRIGHKLVITPYISVECPLRKKMTAGQGVKGDTTDPVVKVKEQLNERALETISCFEKERSPALSSSMLLTLPFSMAKAKENVAKMGAEEAYWHWTT